LRGAVVLTPDEETRIEQDVILIRRALGTLYATKDVCTAEEAAITAPIAEQEAERAVLALDRILASRASLLAELSLVRGQLRDAERRNEAAIAGLDLAIECHSRVNFDTPEDDATRDGVVETLRIARGMAAARAASGGEDS
jgi:hypothetical protein